jgi:hypothetical protein
MAKPEPTTAQIIPFPQVEPWRRKPLSKAVRKQIRWVGRVGACPKATSYRRLSL